MRERVAREAAREFERERKKKGEMFSWAWTLLHQAMPAAGAEEGLMGA